MSALRIIEPGRLLIVGVEASFLNGMDPNSNASKVVPPLWDRLFTSGPRPTAAFADITVGWVRTDEGGPAGHLRYTAGYVVPGKVPLPEGWVLREVPAGQFAVFEHRGPLAGLGETLRHIYTQALPTDEWVAGDDMVEIYGPQFHPTDASSRFELRVRVERRAAS